MDDAISSLSMDELFQQLKGSLANLSKKGLSAAKKQELKAIQGEVGELKRQSDEHEISNEAFIQKVEALAERLVKLHGKGKS